MALWDLRPQGGIWTGVAIGVGLLVAPIVIPVVAAAARPVLKAALKGGFVVFEKSREMLADAVEVAEDVFEEAKAEVRSELAEAKD
jgi:threonine dehydratase